MAYLTELIAQPRILPTTESPVVVAWDNPFPAFHGNKKNGKKQKEASLQKASQAHDPSTKSDHQPKTSQGHGSFEHSRPHTSQGRPRPTDAVTSPNLPSANPVSPMSLPSSIMPSPVDERVSPIYSPSSGGGRSVPEPSRFQHASEYPVSPQSDEAMAPLPTPRRSMTMPEGATAVYEQRRLHKRHGSTTAQGTDVQRSASEADQQVSPPHSSQANHVTGPSSLPTNVAHSPTAGTGTARGGLMSPEMPNFDAISPSANEKNEDPLNRSKPIYQKPTYAAASVGFTPLSRSQTAGDLAGEKPNRPDLTGFSFDLPTNGNFHRSPSLDQPTSPHSYDAPPQRSVPPPSSQGRFGDRAKHGDPQYHRSQSDEHTSRLGSGQRPNKAQNASVGTPVDGSTGYAHPRPPPPGPQVGDGQPRGIPPAQQQRSATAFQPRSHNNSWDEYNPGGDASRPPPVEQPRFYNSQDASLAQPNSSQVPDPRHEAAYNAQPFLGQPPPRVGSAPPVQQSADGAAAKPINPDALPAHPVPVRPGLLRKQTGNAVPPAANRTGISPIGPTVSSAPIRNGPMPVGKPAPVTISELETLSQKVKHDSGDRAAAMTLVKKLVEAASVLADEGGKADAKTTQKNRERYMHDAHKQLKKLVHKNYGDATFYMAECYGHGTLGLPVDSKEAFHLYQSAAKGGHHQAAYRVAVCYEMGNEEGGGTRRDPVKAVHWYKRAAAWGDPPAMYKLGIILLKGLLGQAKNPREAVSLLKRAADKADRENPHALHELALLHENATPNDPVVRDENHARELFMRAADLGYKYSQFRLGSAFEYGLLGCPIDPRHSIGWYTQAAAQGEHQSELALSGWYLTGADGILQQSDTEAFLWARKAAGSGLAKAEYAMGYFTEVGIGCTANLDEAKKWYWRAACKLVFRFRNLILLFIPPCQPSFFFFRPSFSLFS